MVGRDGELAAVHDALLGEGGARALVLSGPPGIGKTTMYEAAIRIAGAGNHRVLSTGGSSTEAPRPFSALIELCDDIDGDELARLPDVQRLALEVALLRRTHDAEPPDPRAIALGFRAVVQNACESAPMLIAIDDVQWIDPSSLDVLSFLARRLRHEQVCFVMTRSSEAPVTIERSFASDAVQLLAVGPLSFGAVRRLLLDRLGLSLPRSVLHRMVDVTGGNPLFLLELGRELLALETPPSVDNLPIPARIEELLERRVDELPPGARRALMLLALCPDLGLDGLAQLVGPDPLDDIVDLRLVQVDGHRVRPTHPLLGAAAVRDAGQRVRRELHLSLAATITDPEQQAMHLALASTTTDHELSGTLARSAARASARGARQQAAELAGHALRLTPPQSAYRSERVLAFAECLETAGEMQRMTDVLTAEMDALPPGPERARAWLMLAEGPGSRSLADLAEMRRLALAEAPDDAVVRARVLAKQASNAAASTITNIPQAARWAAEAVTLTEAAAPALRRAGLYALAWTRAMSGQPLKDLCALSRATSDVDAYIAVTPERVAGQRHVWRGEIPAGRAILERLLALADERGEVESYALMRLHLCELHLRVGEWDAAGALLSEWAESADRELMFRPKYERCRALLAVGRGDAAETSEWAGLTIARGRETGCRWDEFEGLRASAIGMLLNHDPGGAAEQLSEVWESCAAEGVAEPGVFPVAPDLVQALVDIGAVDRAADVVSRLRAFAAANAHPWASVTEQRGSSLVELADADGDHRGAADRLGAAAAEYDRLGLRFDAARCLLSLGRAQRRLRQWGSARAALEQAATIFDGIGSTGWAGDARAERDRTAARGSTAAGLLTPSERRTAERAAEGMSNKEIARELGVTVHTVEVHLSRVYAKLAVASRGRLAARLRLPDADQPDPAEPG
ncbi:MAG TPA: AAA family ATPase [Mycobacteriales bacterium]|nr:AAA family ATPase [Mycobacteriales bacterium]